MDKHFVFRKSPISPLSRRLALGFLTLFGLSGPALGGVYYNLPENPVTYPTGTLTFGIAAGDFNNDGYPDLATASLYGGGLTILLNNRNETFTQQGNFSNVGTSTVAVADINGDGNQDLVLSGARVMLGDGQGNFAAGVVLASAGPDPFAVAVGDFNGDGKPDLVVVNYNDDRITILLNQGGGNFAAPTTYSTGGQSTSIGMGDFNGDGKLDLAVANFGSNDVSILLGAGDGTFSPAVNYSWGESPISIAVGDFNGDGKPDLAVAMQAGNKLAVALGNGDGTFAAPVDYPLSNWALSVSIVDFNSDGKPDLAVADMNLYDLTILPALTIFLNDGLGAFTNAGKFSVFKQVLDANGNPVLDADGKPTYSGVGPLTVLAKDLNGDGKADMVLGDTGGKSTVIFATGMFVSSIAPANSPAAGATDMNFTVTFNQAVSGVDITDFTLTKTGSATGTIGAPTTSDHKVYTVPVTGISGAGTLRLDLKTSGANIAATANGNEPLTEGYSIGTVHTVETGGGSQASIPGIPTAVVPTAGNGSISVAFDAPASNGGASITEYTASCAPSNTFTDADPFISQTGASSPIEVSGLTNDVEYQCKVKAKNSAGYGEYSALSVAATPREAPQITVPGAPTNITPSAGNASVSVAFTAPANNGGAGITEYTASCAPSNTFTGGDPYISQTGASSPINVTGLTNGVEYQCKVKAKNSAGYGDFSALGVAATPSDTPQITVPGASTNVVATAGNASVSVAFTAPANNGGADVSEYTVSCDTANRFDIVGYAFNQTGASSPITVSGLTNGTAYQCLVKARNSAGYGNYSGLSASFTPSAPAPAPEPPGGDPTPPPNVLPTGGGTATLTTGQSVTVTENGKDGTAINLPPPSTSTGGTNPGSNSVSVTLPGTGAIGVSSDTAGTQLGVTHVTLPGATTSVSTVTVDQGSASFTASQSGQAMAGLKNGIVVVSGSKDSQVSVDSTGASARIGIKGNDTLVVPTGSSGVSGTKVDLPPPGATGGQAATVNLNIGGHELTITSSQANTTMTFEMKNIGGVQTPVLAVTGSAQVTSSGEDKPIVSIGGNVIKSGKSSGSGGSRQVCNTVVQASSDVSSDVVHVVTCYIVLEPGSFSSIGGAGNAFAAIKDGIVWAGETAEFDKNGIVTSAYLGSKEGSTNAVGDDLTPGGNKFTIGGYNNNAFIPRLDGAPLRLTGANLNDSLFKTLNAALGTATTPAIPVQSVHGVLNFQISGDTAADQKAHSALTFSLNGDQVSVMPTRRIRVDTSRADGVSVSAEGNVEVATGGLVTIFAPSVGDPQVFAAKVAQALPGATSELRWNGTWKVTSADGASYIGRPVWNRSAQPNGATFAAIANGNVVYNDGAYSQVLVADFDDYTTLQATFAKELNDPNLKVVPRMDGTAIATLNGKRYTLTPQWDLVKPADVVNKPTWWVENNRVYVKNADGTAQGFSVR